MSSQRETPTVFEGSVWITGVGASTPLGSGFDAVADGLIEGRSGVRPIDDFDVSDQPCRVAGRVDQTPCPEGWDADEFAGLRPLERLVISCCVSALRDSGLWDRRHELRVGLVLGLGAEWLITWEGDGLVTRTAREGHPARSEPLVETARRELDLTGPALGLSAACASGNHALAQAKRWLRLGWADICLAGACDAGVTPMSLACFGNLRALTRRNDRPQAASRPFDRDRDGFVIGEGGAVFVLEPERSARSRGARVYAEVAGFGATSDAYHPVIPSPDPSPAVAAIRSALAEARVEPAAISYVNAHATGTPVGDALEANALRIVLGGSVSQIPVSSTKSMTGHLLTAAGAFECLACLAAIDRRALPPTINLDAIDPQCADLMHVALEARAQAVDVAVSNSLGFGGSNTCLVLKAV